MLHQVALSGCSTIINWDGEDFGGEPVGLYAAYLDANGNPNAFLQDTNGVWYPSKPLTAPTSGTATVSIVGLPNLLILLGEDRQLYASSYSDADAAEAGWSTFFPLLPTIIEYAEGDPDLPNAPSGVDDFCATVCTPPDGNGDAYLVIVAVQHNIGVSPDGYQTDAGFYVFTVNLTNSDGTIYSVFEGLQGTWTSLTQSSTGLGDGSANSPAIVATEEAITVAGTLDGSVPVVWFSTDLINWTPAFVEDFLPIVPIDQIVLTQGYPGGTLQAIVVAAGILSVFFSSSGANPAGPWILFPNLLPEDIILPPKFTRAAFGFGNDGFLQVVGIGPTVYPQVLPYLVWQNLLGVWTPFPYGGGEYGTLANDFPVLQLNPVDLAIQQGWGPGQQSFLQVVYLASNGALFISYQDEEGNWRWYPGLDGTGLP